MTRTYAFHGYTLTRTLVGDGWFVEKDGSWIASFRLESDARRAVEELTA